MRSYISKFVNNLTKNKKFTPEATPVGATPVDTHVTATPVDTHVTATPADTKGIPVLEAVEISPDHVLSKKSEEILHKYKDHLEQNTKNLLKDLSDKINLDSLKKIFDDVIKNAENNPSHQISTAIKTELIKVYEKNISQFLFFMKSSKFAKEEAWHFFIQEKCIQRFLTKWAQWHKNHKDPNGSSNFNSLITFMENKEELDKFSCNVLGGNGDKKKIIKDEDKINHFKTTAYLLTKTYEYMKMEIKKMVEEKLESFLKEYFEKVDFKEKAENMIIDNLRLTFENSKNIILLFKTFIMHLKYYGGEDLKNKIHNYLEELKNTIQGGKHAKTKTLKKPKKQKTKKQKIKKQKTKKRHYRKVKNVTKKVKVLYK